MAVPPRPLIVKYGLNKIRFNFIGEDVSIDNCSLFKKEWNKLLIAFDLKDKLI
jgi:hypothetical protein